MFLVKTFLVLILAVLFSSGVQVLATSYEVDIYATVPGCGDAVIQTGEQCDGLNLGGSSCSLQGYTSGNLSCSSVCTLVTTACVLEANTPSSVSRSQTRKEETIYTPATNLVVAGLAEPGMRIQLLRDGILVATTIATDLGFYQTTISGLSAGEYRLQVRGISDFTKLTTQTETFTVRVVAEATTKVSEVALPPVFLVTQTNDRLVIKGRTTPFGFITPVLDGALRAELATSADALGYYALEVDDLNIEAVVLQIQSSGTDQLVISSLPISIDRASSEGVPGCGSMFDISRDCVVNLIDFQMARWVYIFNPASLYFDFDKSSTLDIVDFSIMAYHWTG